MGNCNNSYRRAHIIATLAAGSTASPYYYMVNMTKSLCKSCCADNAPVFNPTFSVVGFSNVGTNEYMVTINVQGIITYNPCGTCCCAMSEPINQNFTIPFYSVAAPSSVTITSAATINAIGTGCGANCGRVFVSETPIRIAVA